MADEQKCFYCGNKTASNTHYLCYVCVKMLTRFFNDGTALGENKHTIIDNPSFVQHCSICGEHENRRIFNQTIPICDKCVTDELFDYERRR